MNRTMHRPTRLLLSVLLVVALSMSLLQGLGIVHAFTDERTTYTIAVTTDGTATWSIERRFLLATAEDVASFAAYQAEFDANETAYLDAFVTETDDLVAQASLITGRTMRTEHFDITVATLDTATGTYGVVTYQYDWVGFAALQDDRIVVGDVFDGGFYLYRDDTLVIQYPANLGVHEASPTPDDARPADHTILYYGQRNFGAGEPRVVVGVAVPYLSLLISASIAGIGAIAFFVYRGKKKEAKPASKPPIQEPFVVTTDEDRVVDLLRSLGGQTYQSMITKRLGWSKSKTSQLMKAMEQQQVVTRERRGREVLVTLTQ